MKFEELKELLMERKLVEVKKIYQEMNERSGRASCRERV